MDPKSHGRRASLQAKPPTPRCHRRSDEVDSVPLNQAMHLRITQSFVAGARGFQNSFDEPLRHDLLEGAAPSRDLEAQSVELLSSPMESLELGQQHHFSSNADQDLGSGSGDGHSRRAPSLLIDLVLHKHDRSAQRIVTRSRCTGS